MATTNDIIKEAKKLEGYAASYNSCIPNNWFYGYNVGGGTAWCAAYVCYVFNQAGARNLIPEMSVNCGVLAKGFYDKGQLVTKNYKAGDVVFFHWSNASSKSVPGVYTLDHVGIIISNNGNGSYTTIEGNTGGSAYGECLIRTRYDYQISCAGRPKYSGSTPSPTPTPTPVIGIPNTYIQVCTAEDGWLPVAKNLTKCVGKDGHAITKVAVKVDKGKVWYQAHVLGGNWLGKVTGWNYKEPINGYAGNGKPIDALKIYYETPSDLRNAGKILCAEYKGSPINSTTFYDWQIDTNTDNGQDGYAGCFGVALDKLYLHLV